MNHLELKAVVRALRASAQKLRAAVQVPNAPPPTVEDAHALLDSLSNAEKTIINHLAGKEGNPQVYGRGTEGYLVLITGKGATRSVVKNELGAVARELVRRHWLTMTEYASGVGYFYRLSDQAAQVFEKLEE